MRGYSKRDRLSDSLLVEQVQRRSQPEPLDLGGAQGVVQTQRFGGPVGVVDGTGHGLAGRQFSQPGQADAVVLTNLVVVSGVAERQCQQALFLQIRFVDASEAAGYDRATAQQSRG